MIETAGQREQRQKAETSGRLARAKDYSAKHNGTSSIETSELVQCEAVIERGMSTFVEVGNALLRIREGRLYRDQYDSFETYCLEKWEMSGRRAHQLVDSAKVMQNLGAEQIVQLPKSEAVTRELAKVPQEKQQAVWEKALELHKGKPTADDVRRVAFPTPLIPHTVAPLHPAHSALNSFQVAWKQAHIGPIWKSASKVQRKKIIEWMNAQ
jgi:hypothetical protein